MDGNYESERGIKSARKTDDCFTAIDCLKSGIEACCLHTEDILASCCKIVFTLWNKRRSADLPLRRDIREFSIKFNYIHTVIAGIICRKSIRSSSVCLDALQIYISVNDRIVIIIIGKSLALA